MRSVSRRRFLSTTVALVSGALALACAPAAQPTPTPARPAEQPRPAAQPTPTPATGGVTITWSTPGNPDELAVYQEVAKRYMDKNPGITVKTDRPSADRDKLVTLLAGGQAPDIIFSVINNWPAFAVKNVFLPLDDYIQRDQFDIQDFYTQILKPYQYDGKKFGQGKLHGLPKEIAVRSMYYNADIFKEVGVKEPDPKEPWTWEVFLDACLKSVKREGDRTVRYGYVQETWWGPWMIWAWSAGGEVVDDPWNPTRATFDNPGVVDGLTFWTDFVVKHKVAPTLAVMQQQGRAEMFAGGLAATYNNGRWMVPLFRKSKFTWDVMPMPRRKERAQLLTGSIFGLWTGSKQRDEAWKVLAHVSSREAQILMTELGLLQPSRRSVHESDVFLKSSPPRNNQVYVDEVQYARILPLHPKYPEMQKAVDDEVALVLSGSKSVADAVKEMNAKVNALLKES